MSTLAPGHNRVRPGRTNPRRAFEWCVKGRIPRATRIGCAWNRCRNANPIMLVYLGLLAVIATAWGFWKARKDYRTHERLTAFGLISVCFMVFMPHLMLGSVMTYGMPRTPADMIGVVLVVLGLGLCLASMVAFRSAMKTLCLDGGMLTVGGPYRWSRNPQYVGWGMFFLGLALNGWSIWCLIPLTLYAIVIHLLILGEEEHLQRLFGDEYSAYCRRISRYVGWRPKRGLGTVAEDGSS